MSKTGLTPDEITSSLTNVIMNLQKELDSTRQEYNKKLKDLENRFYEKDTEIERLKEALIKKGTNKESSPLIEKFKIERDMISQELIKKTNELKSAYLEISNLNITIETQKQKIEETEKNKNKKIEELNEKYKNSEIAYFILQKKCDTQAEENEKLKNTIKEKDEIIKELNKKIQELKK